MNFSPEHNVLNQTNNQNADSSGSPLDDLDFDKIKQVFVKNVIWMLLILLLINASTVLYVRYTKPIYSSESILKLDIKSEAGILGIQNPMDQDIKGLSGEIEILKSRLFASQVVNAVGMDVSYFRPGRSHLSDERYGNSPFQVLYNELSPELLDRRIYIEFVGDNHFYLSLDHDQTEGRPKYKFGEMISHRLGELTIQKTSNFASQKNLVEFYFIINSEDALINYFQKNIVVEPINFNANTIKIALSDPNKYKAKSLLQAIDTIYLNFTKAAKNLAVEQKISFLDRQMKKTQVELEQYEDYFEKFTIQNRTTDLSRDLNNTIQLLNQLDSQRFKIRNQITAIELASEQLEEGTPISPVDMPKEIMQLLVDYNKLKNERMLKLESYNENTQVIQRLNQRLEISQNSAKFRLTSYLDNLISTQKELAEKRKFLESNFAELPSMGTSYNKNRRLHSLQEEFYFSLIHSKIELEIAKAGTVTNFVILSPASMPNEPIKPKKLIIYGAGAIISLVICFLFGAIAYISDDKISNSRELEKHLMAPLLGVVPKYRAEKLPTTRLVVSNNPKSSMSEALRSIRTNMEFMSSGNGRKIISITSTVSGEGKTFITVNLAAIFAYSGLKVVVIDLDMRKPKVHLAFGKQETSKGVSTILIGKNTVDECLNTTEVEDLHYISAGPTPPNPSELLLGKRYDEFISELKEKFDIIMLDTPPVGLVTDGILVMKKSDLPLYVVRANYSKRSYLKSVHGLIRNNKFHNMSVIFNSASNKGTYGYGYGSGGTSGYYEETVKSKKRSFFRKKS
ncbi:tyrosine-protein kinase [Reichenbachiella sp. MSK19-1]|uniref:GumC family protein n=1 Tax=Reichenbachiella sp. MSK19-1 TaxID=1897631 RepID=UPI000E6CF185|nr:tyrosine-protein kinase [Reichenbachiella sp. MSK19-1]RJE71364.1 hypothetical protein BGP76_04500 [Reichenbachiella sp. MSK19-1]